MGAAKHKVLVGRYLTRNVSKRRLCPLFADNVRWGEMQQRVSASAAGPLRGVDDVSGGCDELFFLGLFFGIEQL